MRIIFLIALQMLVELRHNRVLWLYALILLGGLGLCEYMSAVALIEAKAFQLSLLGQLIRWAAVLVLLQFVVSSLSREFNEKGADYVLALPISRSQYILGKALGVLFVASVLLLLAAGLIALYQINFSSLAWLLSLWLELLIVACFALFVAVSLQNTGLAAAVVMAFYILCRALASIELLTSQPLVEHQTLAQEFMAAFTVFLSYLLPSLYEFAPSPWLVYGDYDSNWWLLGQNLMQAMVYCILLLSAAAFDLYRKRL